MAQLRSDLRTRARLRADQDNATFPTDTQYNLYLDEAGKDVFGDLVMSGWPPDFSTTTVTANGSASYAIGGSDTVFSVIGVWTTVGGEVFELKRINEGDRATLRSQSAAGAPSEWYDLRVGTSGPVIYLFPTPSSGTYTVDYVPAFPGFANDSAAWRGPDRSDELIVLCAARKAVLKEGRVQDASVLLQEYQYMLDKVARQASWFDQRNAARIRDVNNRGDRRTAFDFQVSPLFDL